MTRRYFCTDRFIIKWILKDHEDFFFRIFINLWWLRLSWVLTGCCWVYWRNLLLTCTRDFFNWSYWDTFIVTIWFLNFFIKIILFCKSIDVYLKVDIEFRKCKLCLKSILHIINNLLDDLTLSLNLTFWWINFHKLRRGGNIYNPDSEMRKWIEYLNLSQFQKFLSYWIFIIV